MAKTSRISNLVEIDMDTDMTTGPVTRSKSRPEPRHLESESESNDERSDDHSAVTRPNGSHRLQQPNVYVLPNLMKVKMDVDYSPIVTVKEEEAKVEVEENVDECSNSETKAVNHDDDSETTQPSNDFTFAKLLAFLREGRPNKRGGCSEDELAEAAINWLKFQSRERSSRVTELLNEFPGKKYKGQILQALANLPDRDRELREAAVNILLECFMGEANRDPTNSTTNDDSCGNKNEEAIFHDTVDSAKTSKNQVKSGGVGSTPAKRPRNFMETSNASASNSSSSIGQQRPLLTITLRSSEPRIEVVKTIQSQKTRFVFESVQELSSNLENDENGCKIWLTVSRVAWQDSRPFIIKFASAISKLSLRFEQSDEASPIELLELLCRLPNLNNLHLASFPSRWRSDENQQKAFPQQNGSSSMGNKSCPSVKTISFGSSNFFDDPQILVTLLEMMPTLNNIFNLPFVCIPLLAAQGKLKLVDKIRSVDFLSSATFGGQQKNVELLSQLANISRDMKLKIADLCIEPRATKDFEVIWKSCGKSWSTILENNKSTIEHLIIQPLARPEMLKYPEMKAVKKLYLFAQVIRVQCKGKQALQFFGGNFDISKTFPNLSEVTLVTSELKHIFRFFPKYANSRNIFHSVTTLNLKFDGFNVRPSIGSGQEHQGLQNIALIFPGVTKLFIDINLRWLEKLFSQILKFWPHLISLKLRLVDIFVESYTEKYFLDPLLTGISKHLREFTLIFDCKFVEKQEVVALISQMTALHGFQGLPDLEVTFAIPWSNKDRDKIREMLIPVEGHVNFNPNYVEPLDEYKKYVM